MANKITGKTENIIQMDFSEEMKNAYRDYAVSVIKARALPDVRDGLKPVQRRILYSMTELGLDPGKPHRKSARIVGDTMGKYHPHGDSSIYDALVHMSEPYSQQLPLVDGHGNFGSIDGDAAAAMRYTEARLSESAMSMLEHIDDGLVEFMPNFDESEQEPAVLPAMLPNLLINGTTGIAVGMATSIPPHNPAEIIDGCIAYVDKPSITLRELMAHIKGPDFPTGGIITNGSALSDIYETGEGRVKVRARTVIENGENGRKNIIITEIPYTLAGNKTRLIEQLVGLMKDKVFDEIYDVRDESSKEGIRIVVEVKKDRDIDNLLNGLYKKSSMEDTYGINLLAVKNQQPYLFNLKSLIQEFMAFQVELYTKEYEHLLDKADKRLEIVEGLIRATDVIDLIIEILRGSSSLKQARDCLIKGLTEGIRFKTKTSAREAARLDFSERQADAILAMPLSRLVGLEILKLHDENTQLLKDIERYKGILGNQKELYKVIKERLREYRKKFNIARHTFITDMEIITYQEEVKVEDVYVLIDRFGYVKSVDAATYLRTVEESAKDSVNTAKVQNSNTKIQDTDAKPGQKGGVSDFAHVVRILNTDRLCVFTAEGNMYQVKASSIPRTKIKDKGSLIQTLCKLDKENVVFYAAFEDMFESQLLFATRNGFIKQVSGIEFETNRSMISSTKLDDGDLIVSMAMLSQAVVTNKDMRVALYTNKGLMLKFTLSEVSELKKTSRGVRAIELGKGDYVVYAGIHGVDDEWFEYGGKKVAVGKAKLRKRGGKGSAISTS